VILAHLADALMARAHRAARARQWWRVATRLVLLRCHVHAWAMGLRVPGRGRRA
jgi:succinate dehydrogenase hydrophobic anchor subunit